MPHLSLVEIFRSSHVSSLNSLHGDLLRCLFLKKQALISCLATTVSLIVHPSLSSIEAVDEEQIYPRAGKGHIFPCLCLSKHLFKEGILKTSLRAHLNMSLWTAVLLLST